MAKLKFGSGTEHLTKDDKAKIQALENAYQEMNRAVTKVDVAQDRLLKRRKVRWSYANQLTIVGITEDHDV